MEFAIIILYAGSKIIQDKQAQSILFLDIEFTYTFLKSIITDTILIMIN